VICAFELLIHQTGKNLKRDGSQGFSAKWERYLTGDSGKASLVYGYNTFLINEDYSYANHSDNAHYASLRNGNGSFSGPNKSAKSESKIEVTHSGSSITYMCNY